jgi:hypothetical protein
LRLAALAGTFRDRRRTVAGFAGFAAGLPAPGAPSTGHDDRISTAAMLGTPAACFISAKHASK